MSSIPRIFISEKNIKENQVKITGSDAFHISKVLRLGIGDKILICDMKRTEYDGTITQSLADELLVTLGESRAGISEFPFEVTLYQGMPKGDKLSIIVQKAVELGAAKIVPVLCERSVSRPMGKSLTKKLERLNKISLSAASQCGRGIVPAVLPMINYKKACEEIKKSDVCFVCYEGSETLHIRNFLANKTPKKISFLIGPEGGLSSGETDLTADMQIPLVGLGNRILRTETASAFVLAAISVLLEK